MINLKQICSKTILVALLSLTAATIYAQNTGKIAGKVTDSKTGEELIGVNVLVDGTSMGAVTDLEGNYIINDIPAGSYNVIASYIGYQSITRYNIVVRSGGNPDLNFELKEALEQLGEVVVQASPFEKLNETPLSIQRLTQEEIATYPGGNNDIAKVVQSLPGVSSSVGGFRNDVIIRGGAPNENVYFLDGVEIPNINHFATQGSAGGPVGLLNVSFFEGVTLTSSAFGAQYDNVLSGVLQFDQRTGNAREVKTNVRVSASEAALTMEGPLFKKDGETANTTFIASVRRSYLQFLFQVIGLPFLPDYWDYQYKINHKIDDYNELNIIGLGSIDDFSINIPDDIDAEQQANLDQVPVIQQRTNTAGISWKRRFKNGSGFMRTTLSSNLLRNEFTRFRDNENQTDIFFQNDSRELENKLRYELTKFNGDWTITSGFLFQNVAYENNTIDLVDGFTFQSENNFVRYGLFGQVSRPFLKGRFTPSFGIRFDGNSFTEDGNNIFRTFSPRLALAYKLDESGRWTANASVGRYFKIPPNTILGFQDNNGNFPNQDAEYIQSDHLVAGLEFLPRSSTRITLEGFYKRYENYPVSRIDSVSLANLGGDFEVLGNEDIESVGLGRTYGLELLIQQKLSKNFYGILAYTLYKSEYTGFDQDNFIPSVWDNRHLLTFTGGYKLPRNWELGLRMRYLGSTPFAPVDLEATNANYPAIIFDYERLGNERLDVFNAIDIRIDKKWNFPNWTFDVFFEVENLLGSEIPNPPTFGLNRDDNGNIIQPQTVVEIQDIDNSTVIPTIGLVIDF
ncbi:MAG: TonB-dependent receptor [Bacteroidota bacterium]